MVEDGHPILIVTAADIAGILRRNSISTSNIDYYLKSIDDENEYFMEHSTKYDLDSRLLMVAEKSFEYHV